MFPDPSFIREYLDASKLPKTLSKLSPEALRYFSIDDTWLDCYIDGGLSVANHMDPQHDTVRLTIKQMINQALATGGPNGTAIPVPRAGFILRSAAVKAAPDLRVTVTRFRFDDSTKMWLEDTAHDPLVRHTRLDDATLLCLVDTPLELLCKITATQPPHQQRFAFDVAPTLDPDTGAVTAVTNVLKISALYTNEAVAPEGPDEKGRWNDLPDEYQLSAQQQKGLYDAGTRCIAPDEIARQAVAQLGVWSAAEKKATGKGPYEDAVPDSCVVGMELNDPCCKIRTPTFVFVSFLPCLLFLSVFFLAQ